jgi:DNA ligase 1
MKIIDIITELNIENGSNYKLATLKKYTHNELLKRILQMTQDRVKYTYGLSMRRWNQGDAKEEIFDPANKIKYNLEEVLDFMSDKLATRKVTGNAAVDQMHEYLVGLSPDDTLIATRVLNRDLRINMGRTQINKVFPNLIQKPVYMRCGLYNNDSAKKIDINGAIIQLKADGTYREFVVDNGTVSATSRSGEEYEYPVHFELMAEFPNGHYFGELTVLNTDGNIMTRSEGNGLINSSNPPHDRIIFEAWDYVTLEEYAAAATKKKCTRPYKERLSKLQEILADLNNNQIRVIETHIVNSLSEALQHCSNWMNAGLEGAILKDSNSVFRDGTNPQQLKLKLELDLDVRITGFQEGSVGTVREKTFGAILFESDDGMIKGRTSGFTDAQLADFNSRREEMIGKIITVQCNDLTKARGNDYYALSHPRFIEVRDDKTETDTLDRALEIKKMAMYLS